MDAVKAKKAVQARKAADAARVSDLLVHLLALIDTASQAGREHITDPLGIIHPPVSPADRTAIHAALKAKGFGVAKQKHGETFITW